MKKRILAVLLVAGAGSVAVLASAQGGPHGEHSPLNFEQADTNADGNISKDEIAAQRAGRFNQSDANGDGLVDFEEFDAFVEAEKARREQARRERRFASLDADGNGFVSADEHAAHNSERRDRRFDRIDKNDDGVISQEERDKAKERMERHRMGRRGG